METKTGAVPIWHFSGVTVLAIIEPLRLKMRLLEVALLVK